MPMNGWKKQAHKKKETGKLICMMQWVGEILRHYKSFQTQQLITVR